MTVSPLASHWMPDLYEDYGPNDAALSILAKGYDPRAEWVRRFQNGELQVCACGCVLVDVAPYDAVQHYCADRSPRWMNVGAFVEFACRLLCQP